MTYNTKIFNTIRLYTFHQQNLANVKYIVIITTTYAMLLDSSNHH